MLNKEALIEVLQKSKKISAEELEKALAEHRESGGNLSDILIRQGIVSEPELITIVSEELRVPVLNLSAIRLDPELLRMVPKKTAEHYRLIPVSKIGSILTLAMCDPLNIFALDELREQTGCSIRPVLTTEKEMAKALEKYSSGSFQIDEILSAPSADGTVEIIQEKEPVEGGEDLDVGQDDAPVIKLMSLILDQALKRRASDIHIEMYETDLRIRYRIDGLLHEAFHPPRKMHGALMSRIKIMSNLDITERRIPQDGRFRAEIRGKEIDFRVSILPMQFGEKAVLRVLDRASVRIGVEKLGFNPEPLKKFKEASTRPYGMILVTGPTGSGKSTTLYAILNGLNTPGRNIMTVEDPVEYQIEGISQTQVLPDVGLSFANGLRSILRQSPDIILVGEIRDTETADIAVKAALTGHLVLSTLHTNSAAGAFTRLIDMGVEPFLVASSLILVTAQRLARKICEHCKSPAEISGDVFNRLKMTPEDMKGITAYRGKGCSVCNQTGYYGRIGIIESLWVDDTIRNLVLTRASTDRIQERALEMGMKTLFQDALEHFKKGNTSLEEVLRITAAAD
ncbi:MAG TPA: ATPase, T2SS/T4P/T4SS family [Candidatus Omnitrophota bacterium]|nr:ATPase, T2SS/T4P/T4SS family [Candidatus Omnitrophota bacterium]